MSVPLGSKTLRILWLGAAIFADNARHFPAGDPLTAVVGWARG